MRKRKFIWTQLVCLLLASMRRLRLEVLTGMLWHQLYMGCRWCTLFTLIIQLVGFDTTQRFDCSVWSVCFYCFRWERLIELTPRFGSLSTTCVFPVSGMILVSSSHADFWLPFSHIRIKFNYSTNVTKFFLLFRSLNMTPQHCALGKKLDYHHDCLWHLARKCHYIYI